MISTATICEQPLVPRHQDVHRQSWPDKVIVDISSLLKQRDDGEFGSKIIPKNGHPSSPVSLLGSISRRESTSDGVPRARSISTGVIGSTIPVKRSARALESSTESPAKRQSKWSPEEDAKIIQLRGDGMKWEDISKHLPGRSAISCRLHYQNYLERRSEWDEDRKNKLARLYERFKADMWAKIAEEMAIPWRAAEAMHWQMGESEMASRAGVTPFSITTFHSNANHHTHQSHPANQRPPHFRSNSSNSSMRANMAPHMVSIPPQLPSLAELTAGLPAYSQHGLSAPHPQPHPAPPSLSLYPSPVSLPVPTHSSAADHLKHLPQQRPPLPFSLKP